MSAEIRLDRWGALAGLALGVADTLVLLALGVDWTVAGRDATLLVGGWFGFSFTFLGWLAGRLALARQRARRDAEIIRRQAEDLEASRKEASENEKLAALGRLAAGIAHEVRNPLGVIRSSASMIQESFEPGQDSHTACGFICDEIDRLDGLIHSLLNFARPLELTRKAVSIERVVERALAIAGPGLEERGVSLSRSEADPVPLVSADPDLAAQVVLDLVTNAAEAVPERGRIEVRTAREGSTVRVDVADSGPGVTVEVAGRVFEPFFTPKARGTGLGLAMAARIAQAHGGELELLHGAGLGPRGSGACFRFRLPAGGEAA